MTEKTHKIDEPDGGQFAALYAACERQLYGFVLSIHPYPDQVEDILQDTLAVLWKQFSSFRNRKLRFTQALTENLYFKLLDNNAGVLFRLLDDIDRASLIEKRKITIPFLQRVMQS